MAASFFIPFPRHPHCTLCNPITFDHPGTCNVIPIYPIPNPSLFSSVVIFSSRTTGGRLRKHLSLLCCGKAGPLARAEGGPSPQQKSVRKQDIRTCFRTRETSEQRKVNCQRRSASSLMNSTISPPGPVSMALRTAWASSPRGTVTGARKEAAPQFRAAA